MQLWIGLYQLLRIMTVSLVAVCSTMFANQSPTESVCCLLLSMYCTVGLSKIFTENSYLLLVRAVGLNSCQCCSFKRQTSSVELQSFILTLCGFVITSITRNRLRVNFTVPLSTAYKPCRLCFNTCLSSSDTNLLPSKDNSGKQG